MLLSHEAGTDPIILRIHHYGHFVRSIKGKLSYQGGEVLLHTNVSKMDVSYDELWNYCYSYFGSHSIYGLGFEIYFQSTPGRSLANGIRKYDRDCDVMLVWNAKDRNGCVDLYVVSTGVELFIGDDPPCENPMSLLNVRVFRSKNPSFVQHSDKERCPPALKDKLSSSSSSSSGTKEVSPRRNVQQSVEVPVVEVKGGNTFEDKDEGYESDSLRVSEYSEGADDDVDVDEEDDAGDVDPGFDLSRKIVLKVGLTFPSTIVLRRVLTVHSIENGYDFYYTHNERDRLTAYCKSRCDCPFKRGKKRHKVECKPSCLFKVRARKLFGQETCQIKSLIGKHTCGKQSMNSKVTARYLAHRYLENFRANPTWKIDAFKAQVLRDLDMDVGYYKCWYARAQALRIIRGGSDDEYKRVWDYAKTIKKYNPGMKTWENGGMPKKKRIKDEGQGQGQEREPKLANKNKCNKCGTYGHNSRTCKNDPRKLKRKYKRKTSQMNSDSQPSQLT